jgi:hypothetical protein
MRRSSARAVSLGYVYSHGLALQRPARRLVMAATSISFLPPCSLSSVEVLPKIPSSSPMGIRSWRPTMKQIDGIYNPDFGTINVVDNTGLSIYNGLLVSVRHTSSQFLRRLAARFRSSSIRARATTTSLTSPPSAAIRSSTSATGLSSTVAGLRPPVSCATLFSRAS